MLAENLPRPGGCSQLGALRLQVIWIRTQQEVCFQLPPSLCRCADRDPFHCWFDSSKWRLAHLSGLKNQQQLLNRNAISLSMAAAYLNKWNLPTLCSLCLVGSWWWVYRSVAILLEKMLQPWSYLCSCRENGSCFGKLSPPC